jgi:hypothetical protein
MNEIVIALLASPVVVAILGYPIKFFLQLSKKLDNIDAKVELGNRGTKQAMKILLKDTYDKQHDCVIGKRPNTTGEMKWCRELDQIFREVYADYKALNGNSVVDSMYEMMNKWRNENA